MLSVIGNSHETDCCISGLHNSIVIFRARYFQAIIFVGAFLCSSPSDGLFHDFTA